MKTRADTFRYSGLDVDRDSLVGHYDLDDRHFTELVRFSDAGDLEAPAVRALATLWYLVAGLSYYKAGAARRVDLADTPVGDCGRRLLGAALVDGLGEFSYRHDLSLDDVEFVGGSDARATPAPLAQDRVLIPFGGGTDSVVTVNELPSGLDRTLFIVSPIAGRFGALEATAEVTELDVVRATRSLDAQLLAGGSGFFEGHVPITAMVTLLAAVAAVATGRGGVVMSNEHSASAPNLRWAQHDVNHQWSKSWVAEELIAAALTEAVGPDLVVASLLRDRSELWVARRFSALTAYHHVFRSCNRAFTQDTRRRASTWCGECDKCLFIDLMLAPFMGRETLASILGSEPLADPERRGQLRALVGVGVDHKPFECVGDPDESAVALARVAALDEWRDVPYLSELSRLTSPDRDFTELLEPQGPTRAPAHWLR